MILEAPGSGFSARRLMASRFRDVLFAGLGLLACEGVAAAQQPPPQYYPQPQYGQPQPQPVYVPPTYSPQPYVVVPQQVQPAQPMPPMQPMPMQPVMMMPAPTAQTWSIDNWDPDAPAPPGWTKSDHVNGGLIATGVVLLATSYITSAFVASVADANTTNNGGRFKQPGSWTPLFVPVGGPFVGIGTLRPNAIGTGALVLDGVLQGAGATAIVLGILDRRT
jgi:hypothetical protein